MVETRMETDFTAAKYNCGCVFGIVYWRRKLEQWVSWCKEVKFRGSGERGMVDRRRCRRRMTEAVGIELRNCVREVEKGLHSRMQNGVTHKEDFVKVVP